MQRRLCFLVLAGSLLPVLACSTTTHTHDLSRPPAALWIADHQGQTVAVLGRPGVQPERLDGKLAGRVGYDLQLIDGEGRTVLVDAPAVAHIRHRAHLSGAWRGALIGAGIGLLPAVIGGFAATACNTECIGRNRKFAGHFAMGFFITLSVPVALGALIGLARGHLEDLVIDEAGPPPEETPR